MLPSHIDRCDDTGDVASGCCTPENGVNTLFERHGFLLTNCDDTLYEGGFGERIIGSGQAMTADTVVWIASMTKAITWTAVTQLVEQGKLELDASASRVIPYLSEVEVLAGFDNAGRPTTRSAERPITLRHLRTHTVGFPYEV